jgi:membrane associated rhomboid family serine protease
MRKTLWYDFRAYVLHSGNVLYKLIFINVAVFIIIGFTAVVLALSQAVPNFSSALELLQEPLSVHSSFPDVFIYAWAFITYQFVHAGFRHIVVNMLIFLFAGRIFREFLGDRKLLSVYLIGGLAGAVVFIIAMQIFPMFRGTENYLMGASASVMAVLAAIGALLPNYTVQLMFIGIVRLIYIVVFLALVDFLSLASFNAGGHFAHIGGLAWGIIYVVNLKKGRDLGAWVNKIFDWMKPGARRSESRLRPLRNQNTPARKQSRPSNRVSQEEVDIILDKIAKSGYESLSQRERDILFRASKEE